MKNCVAASHSRQAAADVFVEYPGGHLVRTGCKSGQCPRLDSRCTFVLWFVLGGILLVRRFPRCAGPACSQEDATVNAARGSACAATVLANDRLGIHAG